VVGLPHRALAEGWLTGLFIEQTLPQTNWVSFAWLNETENSQATEQKPRGGGDGRHVRDDVLDIISFASGSREISRWSRSPEGGLWLAGMRTSRPCSYMQGRPRSAR